MQTIRSAGLVLVADLSDEEHVISQNGTSPPKTINESPEGVDGYIQKEGVLRFHESIEM